MTFLNSSTALNIRDFRLYLISRFLGLCSHQMLVIAFSQYLYEKTNTALSLGYIGLVLFLPKITFTLLAGHYADLYERKKIMVLCRSIQCAMVIAMLVMALLHTPHLWLFYAALLIIGIANTFEGPASHALVAQLVPLEGFQQAIALNSSVMQLAFITGPALGGFLYAATQSPILVFILILVGRLSAILLIQRAGYYPPPHHPEESFLLKELFSGVKHVFSHKIILGAISLDLFAVLLGGVIALLPIFANDILKIDAWGLGLLRAAPSLGATLMAVWLMKYPPQKKSGVKMFYGIAIYGIFIVLFAISKNFYFSMFCLFIQGAADMMNVVVRGVLVSTQTPLHMRGRVTAVNLVFVGASNELGEFESGMMAHWFGAVKAGVIGGIGTLLVVGIWSAKFKELRRYEIEAAGTQPSSTAHAAPE